MFKHTVLGAILLATTGCASPGQSGPGATGTPSPDATASRAPIQTTAPTRTLSPSPTQVAVLPGETWLAYGWATDQGWYVALRRPDGSDDHEILSDVPGQQKRPAWSPDGMTIAFVVQDADTPEGSIWTANADGSGAALLSNGGVECPVGLFHPAWSPDGTKLALICYPGGDQESIAVMDLATKTIRRLATYKFPDHLDNAPTWSVDGATLAFDLQHFDSAGESLDGSLVATVPVAGGDVKHLTSFDTFMSYPDWSPDGQWLAMNSYDLGNISATDQPSNVYVMSPDGSGLRQLTHSSVDGSMRIGGPRWDPDGTRLVVSIATSSGANMSITEVRLAFLDAGGGEPVLISQIDGKYADIRPTP